VHRAPSSANRRAIASPMPWDAPVMMHLLPAKLLAAILESCIFGIRGASLSALKHTRYQTAL